MIPNYASPLSDQDYWFAIANAQREEEMVLPIIEPEDALLDFEDGRWTQQLLPIYDIFDHLLHPKHYDSLIGALVDVTVNAVCKVDEEKKVKGCYLQVRKMQLLSYRQRL